MFVYMYEDEHDKRREDGIEDYHDYLKNRK